MIASSWGPLTGQTHIRRREGGALTQKIADGKAGKQPGYNSIGRKD